MDEGYALPLPGKVQKGGTDTHDDDATRYEQETETP